MSEDPRVEAVARAMCSTSGYDPEEIHVREGFTPIYTEGWELFITEAKIFIAAYEALLPKQGT